VNARHIGVVAWSAEGAALCYRTIVHEGAELMLESARKLAAAGADFLICPDNTLHQALPLEEALVRGYRRLGILGTRWLVAACDSCSPTRRNVRS